MRAQQRAQNDNAGQIRKRRQGVELFQLLFIGVLLMVLVCQFFVIPGAIQPAGVVLCIILFNTPVDAYISYPLNRILDTAIGVIVGILINMLISRERVAKIKKLLHLKSK